jgi:hypothetical protein
MLEPAIMTSPPVDREPSASTPSGPRSRPPLTLSAGRTVVVFIWHADRWRHVVSVDGMPLAASMEDTTDGRDGMWPASPPLVELSTIETSTGLAILAVGLAGRSHYSASIAPHPSPMTFRPRSAGRTLRAPRASVRFPRRPAAGAIDGPSWSHLAIPRAIDHIHGFGVPDHPVPGRESPCSTSSSDSRRNGPTSTS